MDPNATLAEIRETVEKWESGVVPTENAEMALDVLTEHVKALDEWLSKGGFMPDAWNR